MDIPINSEEAEFGLLGAILIDNSIIPYVINDIKLEHFYNNKCKIVYKTIVDLAKRGITVDLITLSDGLKSQEIMIKLGSKEIVDNYKKSNVLEDIGGIIFLTELTEACPLSTNFLSYLKIIKEKYLIRRYKNLSEYISSNIVNNLNSDDIAKTIEKELNIINSLGGDGTTQDSSTILRHHLDSLIDSLDEGISDIKSIRTGYDRLDAIIGGLHGGNLIVIAASSSIGKTMMGINIMNNITERGKRALLFTMEMKKQEIMNILITINSDIKYAELQNWSDRINILKEKYLILKDKLEISKKRFETKVDLTDNYVFICNKEIEKVKEEIKIVRTHKENLIISNEEKLDLISKKKLFIDDNPGITTSIIRKKIMELSVKEPLDLIIVDQLSLMNGEGKGIRERYDIITGELKNIAREYNIPIILIVQLKMKDIEARPGHIPQSQDIKESSKIYEDADKVLLLNRPMHWVIKDGGKIDEFTDSTMHVLVTKNRGGALGTAILGCDPTHQKIYNASNIELSKVNF